MRRFIRRRRLVVLLGAAAILVVVLGMLWRSAIKKNRGLPDEPFRIAGNLYYVGNAGVTSLLLAGPDGHVLIDGGYPESASAIMASIAKWNRSSIGPAILSSSIEPRRAFVKR